MCLYQLQHGSHRCKVYASASFAEEEPLKAGQGSQGQLGVIDAERIRLLDNTDTPSVRKWPSLSRDAMSVLFNDTMLVLSVSETRPWMVKELASTLYNAECSQYRERSRAIM
jgi:hypothetical protein